jgi:hypothetical protein
VRPPPPCHRARRLALAIGLQFLADGDAAAAARNCIGEGSATLLMELLKDLVWCGYRTLVDVIQVGWTFLGFGMYTEVVFGVRVIDLVTSLVWSRQKR